MFVNSICIVYLGLKWVCFTCMLMLIATLAFWGYNQRFPGTLCRITEVSGLVLLEIMKSVHACARFQFLLLCCGFLSSSHAKYSGYPYELCN